MVGNSILSAGSLLVGGRHEGGSSRKCIEVVGDHSLDLRVLPGIQLLPPLGQGGDVFVDRGLGVHLRGPEWLSVLGVIAAVEALLSSVVHNWDSFCEENEIQAVFEHGGAVDSIEEPAVVVVVEEQTEGVGISKGLLGGCEGGSELVHRPPPGEDINQSEVERILEHGWDGSLIASSVVDPLVEDLSDGVDSSGGGEISPKVLFDEWDRVDSDTIDSVVLNQIVDPAHESVLDEWNGLVEVWETGQPTVLHPPLILHLVGGVDLAVLMEILGLVEGD